ncbi:MAG: hypothetical protein DWQ07_14065 [Chloroflexi bacterium]|nr:MAG: hypothetical protein DWQ07_14065 [Chloroflexota bacterium]
MITFYHITIEANIPSILREGLLVGMSRGAPRNWFCLDDDLDSVAKHIYDLYGARPTYWLVTWETDQDLLKWRSPYWDNPFWYTKEDVPASELEASCLGEYLLINTPPYFTYGRTRWAEEKPFSEAETGQNQRVGRKVAQTIGV